MRCGGLDPRVMTELYGRGRSYGEKTHTIRSSRKHDAVHPSKTYQAFPHETIFPIPKINPCIRSLRRTIRVSPDGLHRSSARAQAKQ